MVDVEVDCVGNSERVFQLGFQTFSRPRKRPGISVSKAKIRGLKLGYSRGFSVQGSLSSCR